VAPTAHDDEFCPPPPLNEETKTKTEKKKTFDPLGESTSKPKNPKKIFHVLFLEFVFDLFYILHKKA
jgi:hypothetical protein